LFPAILSVITGNRLTGIIKALGELKSD